MTKHYHLTQEQALAIWLEAERTIVSGSLVQAAINAALDKVLGEPVAWSEAGREHNVIANLVKQTNKNDWVKPYTLALYAPRREK